MELDRYLEELESLIDESVEDQLLSEWRAFADGEFTGDIFSPKRIGIGESTTRNLVWPKVNVNKALHDYHAMALQQFNSCASSLATGSGNIMCVRCNYGTGIMPSLWGAAIFEMEDKHDTLPTTRPLPQGKESIRLLVDRGIPDFRSGYGSNVFEMVQVFVDAMKPYPKVAKYISIYHPDLQGPMDICELLWGSSIFLDIYDEPELVISLLELVTDTYIAFMNRWNSIVHPDSSYSIHWSMLHKGRVMIRDDSAMNFSPAMCDEFIKPYDSRILSEFGGGAIHFCGRGSHWLPSFSQIHQLYAVNLSQPHYNDMEIIYKNTVDKGMCIIGLDRNAANEALHKGRILHGRVHCW